MDGVGIAVMESIRAQEPVADVRLIASYLVSSGLYQAFGLKITTPLFKDVKTAQDQQILYAGLKIIWNSLALGFTSRLFGGRINLVNSALAAAGAETISYGLGEMFWSGGDYVGPAYPIPQPSAVATTTPTNSYA